MTMKIEICFLTVSNLKKFCISIVLRFVFAILKIVDSKRKVTVVRDRAEQVSIVEDYPFLVAR
jgi:hypothetical protein